MDIKRPNSIIIKGTGKYVPEKIVTNDDLSKIVDTSDEWIFGRSRHKAPPHSRRRRDDLRYGAESLAGRNRKRGAHAA